MTVSYFGKARNVELSTIKYVEDSINGSWDGISTVKGYPNFNKLQVPVISVVLDSENSTRREIGSTAMNDTYSIVIEVFAKSNGQRLDLAQFIKDLVTTGWTYYTHAHASGGTGTLDLTSTGMIKFVGFTQNARVDFFDDVEFYDRYRHIVGVDVRVD